MAWPLFVRGFLAHRARVAGRRFAVKRAMGSVAARASAGTRGSRYVKRIRTGSAYRRTSKAQAARRAKVRSAVQKTGNWYTGRPTYIRSTQKGRKEQMKSRRHHYRRKRRWY